MQSHSRQAVGVRTCRWWNSVILVTRPDPQVEIKAARADELKQFNSRAVQKSLINRDRLSSPCKVSANISHPAHLTGFWSRTKSIETQLNVITMSNDVAGHFLSIKVRMRGALFSFCCAQIAIPWNNLFSMWFVLDILFPNLMCHVAVLTMLYPIPKQVFKKCTALV